MKTQYLVEVKFAKAWDNKFVNACVFDDVLCHKRYLSTKADATDLLKRTKAKFKAKEKVGWETTGKGIGAITTYNDDADLWKIVETRIRKRQVTDWEEC